VSCCSGRWPDQLYGCAHCNRPIRHDGDREWVHHDGPRDGLMTCSDPPHQDRTYATYAHPTSQSCPPRCSTYGHSLKG
jgi:hypothetical protein